ncbi:S-adenosyl-L-methionine-dependent methyltransferase [Paraphysoderma sedebokerense]|nr:S-adenosyl-L-methionine-dependent methyltransferase [Paraphysoderma sedebokerense]
MKKTEPIKSCVELAKQNGGWEEMHKTKNTPWDAGKSAPALLKLLKEGKVPNGDDQILVHRRALVPGCGRGYDVFNLASENRYAVGLDISDTVIAECQQAQKERNIPDLQATFLKADFFTFPTEKFDTVYDYTFLCALQPPMRPDWARRMYEIIKPGGLLITLMFPIDNHEDGPPFAVSPELYRQLLTSYFDEVSISDCESFPARAGREKLGLWRRKAEEGKL